MENPFEKKPLTFIIALGALVVLILGAGVISILYGTGEIHVQPPNSTSTTNGSGTVSVVHLPGESEINFDAPYPISWDDGVQDLIVRGSYTRRVETKASLTGIYVKKITLPKTQATNYPIHKAGDQTNAIVLKLAITIKDPLTSTYYKICDVPLMMQSNIRRVTDESGELALPHSPSLELPAMCFEAGTAARFDQEVIFPIGDEEHEFTFTSGNQSNVFFLVSSLEEGSINVEKVPKDKIPG